MNRAGDINQSADIVVLELSDDKEVGRDVTDGSQQNRGQQQSASNFYHTKKSAAEGMMDLSLLTANANQLKFILYYNQGSHTFYPALILIILSLILQVAVGILLIFRVSRVNNALSFQKIIFIWVKFTRVI